MEIEISMRGSILVVKPMDTALDLKAKDLNKVWDSIEAGESDGGVQVSSVMFDCDDLRILHSSGIGNLIRISNTLKEKKLKLVLYNLSNNVREVLEISQMDKVFTIFNFEHEAVEFFAKK